MVQKIRNFNQGNINTNKPLIEIINLSKEFDGEIVLKEVNLTIRENEFVTLLGHLDVENYNFKNFSWI